MNLISDSEAGMITYSGKGRRNKKKEAAYLEERTQIFNKIAQDLNMIILWEMPLTEPRFA